MLHFVFLSNMISLLSSVYVVSLYNIYGLVVTHTDMNNRIAVTCNVLSAMARLMSYNNAQGTLY